ncbi:MAG: phenylacetic acid-responsive transcriptional repressor [Clostridia bacterium]|jgi:phenylacetic acid degradation operon negative regulatory protein|nr:phenylacetic acid-responsive transcriptional repressor [Clostridia bacterium]
MKLILRKNDSATSLLLFIYNHYFSKSQKNSLRLSSLLEIIKVFDKSESAIRMSLSRAVKAGILSNAKQDNEVIYSLTDLGRKSIHLWNEGVQSFWKRFNLRNSSWDGKWYILNIEFQEDKKQRMEISDNLQQLGFTILNTNTWICPYNQSKEIRGLATKFGLETAIVEFFGEMTVGKDMQQFLDDTYKLDILKSKYKAFIHVYGEKLKQTKEICEEHSFIDRGQGLPLLHELGWNFFNIASEDPVLPKQLYPFWEGDEAAALMKELREVLLEASWQYLEKFE